MWNLNNFFHLHFFYICIIYNYIKSIRKFIYIFFFFNIRYVIKLLLWKCWKKNDSNQQPHLLLLRLSIINILQSTRLVLFEIFNRLNWWLWSALPKIVPGSIGNSFFLGKIGSIVYSPWHRCNAKLPDI